MIGYRSVRLATILALSAATISCSDSQLPTAPSSQVVPQTTDASFLSDAASFLDSIIREVTGFVAYPEGKQVKAIRWSKTHARGDKVASAVIGYEGGTIAVPGADFTINFPAGALNQPTFITIVSKDGPHVAYDMLPHGLRFAKPIIATQRLRNTAVYGTSAATKVYGAYLADGRDQIATNDIAIAVEIVPSSILLRLIALFWVPDFETWTLTHFSRYILASG